MSKKIKEGLHNIVQNNYQLMIILW